MTTSADGPTPSSAGQGTERRWRRALVTGASSGIGDAIARRLAAQGTDLVVVARDGARLERLAHDLTAAHGVAVEVLPADLSAPVSRDAVESRVASVEDPVDLLVNNAGFGTHGDFAELPVDREEQEVSLNVVAVLRLTSAALGRMVPGGGGHVLNIASIGGLYPIPGSATYGATKAFLLSFGDAVHEELRGTGVVLTTSLPGFTRTEFQERADWDDQDRLPGFAWVSPDEVARESLDGAWAGRARVVPSRRYQAVTALTAPIPPFLKRTIMGRASGLTF